MRVYMRTGGLLSETAITHLPRGQSCEKIKSAYSYVSWYNLARSHGLDALKASYVRTAAAVLGAMGREVLSSVCRGKRSTHGTRLALGDEKKKGARISHFPDHFVKSNKQETCACGCPVTCGPGPSGRACFIRPLYYSSPYIMSLSLSLSRKLTHLLREVVDKLAVHEYVDAVVDDLLALVAHLLLLRFLDLRHLYCTNNNQS